MWTLSFVANFLFLFLFILSYSPGFRDKIFFLKAILDFIGLDNVNSGNQNELAVWEANKFWFRSMIIL